VGLILKGVFTKVLEEVILKGQYGMETRAAQEDKNDTQQNILIKIGRIYWPTITNSNDIYMKKAE
jgi:hypothetical protein